MPYKIAGQPGTWYEPGTRKGNANISWRGQLPDGNWTEFVTDSAHQSGAQAFLRRFLEQWHRDRPPAAGAQVDLEVAAHHYKAAECTTDGERDRADRVVRYLGARTAVETINQSHVTLAANAFRAERAAANARAAREGRQTYPPPSAETVNREVTTPLRAIVHFAARQGWRPWIVLKAVKPLPGELPRPPRPAARDDHVDRLLRAIESAIADCRLTPAGRDKETKRRAASLRALAALVTLVHERGYRISEWLRWTWDTIDLPNGRARILLSKPTRWAEFELGPEAVASLSAMPARDLGKVFPWAHRSAVYAAIDAIAPEGVSWRPHESRRAVVTAVLRNTGDPAMARDYVGHASIKTTLRYRVVDPGEVHPQVRARDSRGGKKPSR